MNASSTSQAPPVLSPPCMVIHSLLPDIRRLLAHDLHADGMTQESIAIALNITQAAVSNYLREYDDSEDIPWYIRDMAASARSSITANKNPTESFCATCHSILASGSLCSTHGIPNCTYCMSLSTPERTAVLDSITHAMDILTQLDFGPYSPEVGMNIAMAVEDARDFGDVAAVPGRIRAHRGRIVGTYTAEFGASRHMANILLRTGHRAVINLKYNQSTGPLKGNIVMLERTDDRDAASMMTSHEHGDADMVIDPGWIGIEPCIYLFGDNAVDVAMKVRDLTKKEM